MRLYVVLCTNGGTEMPDNLYVSDTAYQQLIKMAVNCGYVKKNYTNCVGLSDFLNRLSYVEFVDTRPDSIKDIHRRALARETQPLWALGNELKISRMLGLSEEAMRNYAETALSLGIVIRRRLANAGQSKRSLISITANTLEAIGIEWITPLAMPIFVRIKITQKHTTIHRPKTEVARIAEDNPYRPYVRR